MSHDFGSSNINFDGIHALKAAFDCLKSLKLESNDRWVSIPAEHKPGSSRMQCLKHKDGSATFKIIIKIKDAGSAVTDWKALLETNGMDKLWDQQVESRTVLHRPDKHTQVCETTMRESWDQGPRQFNWIKRITHTKDTLLYVAAADPPFMWLAFEICSKPTNDTQVSLYFRIDNCPSLPHTWLESYVISLATRPLKLLESNGRPPHLCRSDPGITVDSVDYSPEDHVFQLLYHVYPHEPVKLSSSVGSIAIQHQSNVREKPRIWHSNSWERDRTAKSHMASLHNGGFMSASPLLYPTFYSSKTQKHIATSFPEAQKSSLGWSIDEQNNSALEEDVAHLEIDMDKTTWAAGSLVDLKLQVTLLGDQSNLLEELNDRFAHLCVRCYQQSQPTSRYIIIISHPTNIMEYLYGKETVNKLDDHPGSNGIQIKLTLQPKPCKNKDCRLLLNEKYWPIRPWSLHTWSAGDICLSEDESKNDGSLADDDIFTHGMEDMGLPKKHGKDEQKRESSPGPSNLTLVTSRKPSTPLLDNHSIQLGTAKVNPEKKSDDTSVKNEKDNVEPEEKSNLGHGIVEILKVPDTDPAPILDAYRYFDSLLEGNEWEITQGPDEGNGFTSSKKRAVSGQPAEITFGEAKWQQCSIWDVNAVIDCVAARKIWDSTFGDSQLLNTLSSTCSLWHYTVKGSWPTSPRDYIIYVSKYASVNCINICSTTCTSDSVGYQSVTPNSPETVRAHLDLAGWRLEKVDNTTASVKHVVQSNLQGWIPTYLLNRLSIHASTVIRQAHHFFTRYGAPPHLEKLICGKVNKLTCETNTRAWRCEYWRPKEDTDEAVQSTRAEIRLDRRRWSEEGKYNVVIDPPPSRAFAAERSSDSFGLWITIEHDEEFIIPPQGKILVLIKPSDSDGLSINGITQTVQKEKVKYADEESTVTPLPSIKAPILEEKHESQTSPTTVTKSTPENASIDAMTERQAIASLPVSPVVQGRAALLLLKRMEEQFGWIDISDKHGTKLSKRAGIKPSSSVITEAKDLSTSASTVSATSSMGALEGENISIPENFMVYKATKVIECFSLEEVASVVTDAGSLREKYDGTVEKTDVVENVQRGCDVIRQTIKSMFPFKPRELYLSACVAHEKVNLDTNPLAKRVLYAETSLTHFPLLKTSKLPRGHQFICGWILESIDPYTTAANHPIPSMRATYVTALDLGTSVPSYISNLVASGSTKKIQWVESYLKARGPPPYAIQPQQLLGWIDHYNIDIHKVETDQENVAWSQLRSSYNDQKRQLLLNGKFSLPRPCSSSDTPPTINPPGIRSVGSLQIPSQSQQRRSSLTPSSPVNDSTERRASSSSTGKRKLQTGNEDIIISHIILDLQTYPEGYELEVRLYRLDQDKHKNVSNLLVVQALELTPEPSHQIGGKSQPKHAIKLTTQTAKLYNKRKMDELYELDWTLQPARESLCNQRGMRLTVSGVLGEEDDRWQGVILVNGREIELGHATAIPVQEGESDASEALPLLDIVDANVSSEGPEFLVQQISPIDSYIEPERPPYMGGGMMAAAIDGVNDLRERMMMPFRAASQSFLSTYAEEHDEQSLRKGENDKEEQGITIGHSGADGPRRTVPPSSADTEQQQASAQVIHSGQPLSFIEKVVSLFRKGFLIILVLLCLAIVVTLLLIPPLARQWSTLPEIVVVPDWAAMMPFQETEGMTLRRLIRLPCLWGGWELQLVAVRHHVV